MELKIQLKMNQIKLMKEHPKLYLANYFSDLKNELDFEFSMKPEENNNYCETINGIEVFENGCYKTKPFNTFNNEIELLD